MCKALIIGAGGVGTVVAQKIAANPIFSDVMLASRTKAKCDAIAAAIGGDRVKTAQVDADNVADLCELFRAFKPDIVVNVALPYQDLTIMDACLEPLGNHLRSDQDVGLAGLEVGDDGVERPLRSHAVAVEPRHARRGEQPCDLLLDLFGAEAARNHVRHLARRAFRRHGGRIAAVMADELPNSERTDI